MPINVGHWAFKGWLKVFISTHPANKSTGSAFLFLVLFCTKIKKYQNTFLKLMPIVRLSESVLIEIRETKKTLKPFKEKLSEPKLCRSRETDGVI